MSRVALRLSVDKPFEIVCRIDKLVRTHIEQESILVRCVPPAFLVSGRGVFPNPPGGRPPLEADPAPWRQTPPRGREPCEPTDRGQNITLTLTSFAGRENRPRAFSTQKVTLQGLEPSKVTRLYDWKSLKLAVFCVRLSSV